MNDFRKKETTMSTRVDSRASGPNRRHFLRGLGACLALPAFESLRVGGLLAAETAGRSLGASATGAPLRTAFVFFPNGAIPSAWWPDCDGTQFQFSRTLKPLEALRDSIQVMGGLNQRAAEGGPDGAGDHARGTGTFLTGVRLNKSATEIRAGESIDQTIARNVGHLTRLRSLELTGDASRKTSNCDSGYSCAYQFNLSWSSPTTPMTPEANPRLVFERLFGEGPPGQRWQNMQRRRQEQRSVLDFVLQDAQAMKRRLSLRDREKLDQYLTGVRQLESAIEKAEQFGQVTDPGNEAPLGVPAEYETHIELMYDMMLTAFQTDSTRVATLLLAHDGSNRSFDQIGISEGHHDLTHHQNRKEWVDKVQDIDLWYVQQFAGFLRKMEDTEDVDGKSLLHNSMIVYGSGNADGNRHTHDNLPIILAGRGGGTFGGGRYVNHGSESLCNLFLTLAERMGVEQLDRFGDSTGPLANI
jgi:hypothetical protein